MENRKNKFKNEIKSSNRSETNLPKIDKKSNFIDECKNIQELVKRSVNNINDILRKTSSSKENLFNFHKNLNKNQAELEENKKIISKSNEISNGSDDEKKEKSKKLIIKKYKNMNMNLNNKNINKSNMKVVKLSNFPKNNKINILNLSNTNRTSHIDINNVLSKNIIKNNEEQGKCFSENNRYNGECNSNINKSNFNEMIDFIYCSFSPNELESNKITRNIEKYKIIVNKINECIQLFNQFT